MSDKEAEAAEICCCCANCGVAEVDDIKLDTCCDGCDLVKYCRDKCMEEHREQHEEDCKKRKVELHDKQLFTQPPGTHQGECPICFLPRPLDQQKSTFKSCCSKYICNGCCYAHHIRNGNDNCPLCREPGTGDDEKVFKRIMKRVKANDPAALCYMGTTRRFEGDFGSAFEYWAKAAELEDVDAHFRLGVMYRGHGVEKDEEKSVYHLEEAAIGGHPDARYELARRENENGNAERAVKHLIIAANLGHERSMKVLWGHYSKGNITKEDLDATLRTNHAAIDEMKSPEREAAEAFRNERERVQMMWHGG
jgi:hypothetical protein